MLGRISGYTFIGSLFLFLLIRGYWARAWITTVPNWILALSVVALIAWMVFSIQHLMTWVKKRSTQFAISLGIMAFASLIIIGTVNWFAAANNKKWDMSQNKFYSLSDQSERIGGELKEEVVMRVWTTSLMKMSENVDLQKFFENYKNSGKGKLKVEIKNPNEDAITAKQDRITRDNVIVVKSASGREARIENFNDTKAEELVTNAIIQAIKGNRKKTLCFTSGHGEASINDSQPTGISILRTALSESSYEAKEIVLGTLEKTPEECEAMVIAGPETDASEREIKMLQDYMAQGGKVIALLGAGTTSAWRKLGSQFGVELQSNIIVDPRTSPPIYTLTRNFSQDVELVKGLNRFVLFPNASSVTVPTQSPDPKASVKTFISSESYTYAKTGDLKNMRTLNQGAGDAKGPLPLAVLITKPIEKTAAAPTGPIVPRKVLPPAAPKAGPAPEPTTSYLDKLIPSAHAQVPGMPPEPNEEAPPPKTELMFVIIGNSSFIRNAVLDKMGNLDLFLNTMNFVLQDKDLMGIRPKEVRQTMLEMTPERARMIETTVFILFLAFIVGAVRAGRRKAT